MSMRNLQLLSRCKSPCSRKCLLGRCSSLEHTDTSRPWNLQPTLDQYNCCLCLSKWSLAIWHQSPVKLCLSIPDIYKQQFITIYILFISVVFSTETPATSAIYKQNRDKQYQCCLSLLCTAPLHHATCAGELILLNQTRLAWFISLYFG